MSLVRQFVWGSMMTYLINKGHNSERLVDADYYDFQADNEFITFWKSTPSETVAVLMLRARSIHTIEAQIQT